MEPREQQVRTWTMLVHLAALATFIIPFGLVLGPLIMWLIKKMSSRKSISMARKRSIFN